MLGDRRDDRRNSFGLHFSKGPFENREIIWKISTAYDLRVVRRYFSASHFSL